MPSSPLPRRPHHRDEFSRWTRDVPMAIGRHGRTDGLWTGPKFTFVHHAAKLVLHNPAEGTAELNVFGRTTSADTSSWVISPSLALVGELREDFCEDF